MLLSLLAIVVVLSALNCAYGAKARGIVKFEGIIETVEFSPRSQLTIAELPESMDWRNINGTNLCSRTLNQKNPNVCGSCWAEALTGALSDRYFIATGGRLQVTLASQNLLNFKKST